MEPTDAKPITLTELLLHAKKAAVMLTVPDAAELAGVTPWYFRQIIASGELRAINIGGANRSARWRIDPEDFRAWMVSRENRRRDLMAS